MPATSACPAAEVFQRLSRGQLPLPEVEQLAQHLEECGRCVDTVQRLHVEDTLLEAMRLQETGGEEDPGSAVEDLMERLRRQAPFLMSTTQATPPRAEAGAPGEAYDFLAPPQGSDEIGRLGGYRVRAVLGSAHFQPKNRGGSSRPIRTCDCHSLDEVRRGLEELVLTHATSPSLENRVIGPSMTSDPSAR
jgi:hypothetical protein